MKFLLHVCCANCGITAIEKLLSNFDLTLFWYNPNIHPVHEYEKRLKDVKKLAKIYGLDLILNDYDFEKWFVLAKGLDEESEGGKRCEVCFNMRLDKTAQFAQKNGFDYWGTTLSTGPQKNAKVINCIGASLGKKYSSQFYMADFKKKEGFRKSIILGKEYNFYRQNYCGCVFSKKG